MNYSKTALLRDQTSANGGAYRAAGVNIDLASSLVKIISPLMKTTQRPGVVGNIGGFGALFDPAAAGYYNDSILVATADGVGTKLKVAIACGQHDTIGIDLVAMSVNDLVTHGAEPLFFLDYFATGQLDIKVAKDVLEGITEGCKQAGCALIGGETAEMPGMYSGGDYDLAGFAVGAVERRRVLTGESIAAGDIVLGIAASGLHSNGFSLVRHLVSKTGLKVTDPAPFAPGQALGSAMLVPTKFYVQAALAAVRADMVKGLAHITGGGLLENIPRILPNRLGVILDASTWPLPPVMRWLKQHGKLSDYDLARTFNCGLGMVAITASEKVDEAIKNLEVVGDTVWRVGYVVPVESALRVQVINTEVAWHD
jgi:phosphoribosylformylglycinamidine cyclo-ligase